MENADGRGRAWKRHDVSNGDNVRRGACHSLYLGDLDGDLHIFTCEMEAVPGDRPARWYVWENLDGTGGRWQEHVILHANLGGHEAVVGDLTGNGLLDIIAKPWAPREDSAVGGKMFVVFLENVSELPSSAQRERTVFSSVPPLLSCTPTGFLRVQRGARL